MWTCACGKDHSEQWLEFVHRVSLTGHHLENLEKRTIGQFLAEYPDAQVTSFEMGRWPLPHFFAHRLNDGESIVGVIGDEFLHEDSYPKTLPDGRVLTSDGTFWEPAKLVREYEKSLATPAAALARVNDNLRAHPVEVLKAIMPGAPYLRAVKLLKDTPKTETVPFPFPHTADAETWEFSNGEKMTVQDLLWDVESKAREKRRAVKVKKATKVAE